MKPAIHPDLQTLQEFVQGRLAEPDSSEIEAHLSDCETCCQRLRTAGQADRFERELRAAVQGGGPDEVAAEMAPRRIGRFETRELLGEGGFGIVLLARDEQLARDVALKLPRLGRFLTAEMRQRFLREARAAAGLAHPNIVPVYEAGEDAGVCYIAAEYCRGPTLSDWLRKRRELVGFALAAQWTADLASAVHHAHVRGVQHRDLKPSNILLSPVEGAGEIPAAAGADWTVKITDFGLAKVASEGDVTRSNLVMGTASYMPPELAGGRAKDAGPLADVYGLGAILYELLTGRPPFVGEGDLETLQRVRDEEPVPPSRLRPKTPRDLETICLTCLHKEPKRRYASAEALRLDLLAFLSGDPIQARPTGPLERSWRLCRQKPVQSLLALSVAVLLAVVVVGSVVSAIWLREQQQATLTQLSATMAAEKAAQQQKELANRQLFASLVSQARSRRLSGRMGQRFESLEALRQAAGLARLLKLPGRERAELRNEMIACLALPDLRAGARWPGYPHGSAGNGIAFSASLERYAMIDRDGQLVVRRMEDNAELLRLDIDPPQGRYPDWRLHLRFSRDGNYLAARGDRFLSRSHPVPTRVWDLRTGKLALPPIAAERERDWAFDFSPDSRSFAEARADGSIVLHSLAKGKGPPPRQLTDHPAQHLRYSPQGDRLLIAHGAALRIISLATGTVVHAFPAASRVSAIAWDRQGTRIAAGLANGQVRIWDSTSGQSLAVCQGHMPGVIHVDFHPRGDLLVSTSDFDTRLWEAATGRLLLIAEGYADAFSDDGRGLALGFSGAEVGRWEVELSDSFCSLQVRTPPHLSTPSISADGRILAVNVDHRVLLWDVASAVPLGQLDLNSGGTVTSARFHPTEPVLLTSTGAGIHRWPYRWEETDQKAAGLLRKGPFTARLKIGPPQPVEFAGPSTIQSFQLDQQGRLLVTDSFDAWITSGQEGKEPTLIEGFIFTTLNDVSASGDGRWVATSGLHAYETRVWDASSGRRVWEFPGRSARHAFSPDSRWLAISNPEGYSIHQTGSWRQKKQFPQSDEGTASPIAFAPSGKLLAIAPSGLATLVRVPSFDVVATFAPPGEERVAGLQFSPDGSRLVAQTVSGALHLWDLSRLHRRLADLGLDWEQPSAGSAAAAPANVELAIELGDFQRIDRLTKEIAASGGSAQRYYELARTRIRFGQWEAAVADLTKTVELEPAHGQASFQRGLLHARLGRLEQAAADFTTALELAPDHAEAARERGRVRAAQGRWNEAIADLTRACEQTPADWRLWFERGFAHLQLGQPKEAVAAFDQALTLDPDKRGRFKATAERAIARFRLLQFDLALADGERALALCPDDYQWCTTFAWGLVLCPDERFRDPAKAIDLAGRSLKSFPQYAAAWRTLAAAYLRQGKLKQASAALDEARKLRDGGDASEWFLQALIHFERDNQAEGRRWFDKAAAWMNEHAPHDPELALLRREAQQHLTPAGDAGPR